MGKRSFDEAAIVATGVQSFNQRFGKRRRGDHDLLDTTPPNVAQWRCNLTGLSQVQNLYFVAYLDKIYVYEPTFLTQALPEQPALIVTSQPAVPGNQGYLDPRHPHAINNLVVQFLGTEEVVATVRDDGDVDAILVRHIAQAIDRRKEAGNSLKVETDEVGPIFQSNVGMSAWGLAIHSEARIIATSANTHNITIFKFGLISTREDESDQQVMESSDREMDVTHHVLNGTSNIPCIAFCNTGDDPKARWLLTTDIGGFCRSIDLHSMQTSQTFRFGRSMSSLGGNSHDRHNSGWAIMFLDRRSFIPEDLFESAIGLEPGEMLPGIKESRSLWDIGLTADHIPERSCKFSAPKARGENSDLTPPLASPYNDSQISTSASGSVTETSSDSEGETISEVEEQVDLDMDPVEAEEDSDSAESTYYFDLDPEDEETEDSVSFDAIYGGKRICGNEPRVLQPYNDLCGDNSSPILHASVRSVYLLQPSDQRETQGSPITRPTVGFTNALHQLVQGQHAWLNVFERLNMNAYIPAIGIVVLASQKGRALILSLTKLTESAKYPATMRDSESRKPRAKYAMRIEHIVPTANQERKLERPFAPLMGIATGPMQGTECLLDEQKRWRLMMMYADHTLLTYEISRRRDRNSGVGLEDVLI